MGCKFGRKLMIPTQKDCLRIAAAGNEAIFRLWSYNQN